MGRKKKKLSASSPARGLRKERKLIAHTEPKSPVAEAYRTLRTNIHFLGLEDSLKTILVTSPGPGEGKSTTTANLAVILAQAGKQVLLLDCDLRKPVVHKIFELSNQVGMTNVLVDRLPLEKGVQETEIQGLRVVTSGPVPPNPSELLDSPRMGELLEEVHTLADIVLIDSPPVLVVTDAAILGAMVSGVILVVNQGTARIDATKQAKKTLENTSAKILGVVLNGVEVPTGDYHYYYYYGSKESL